ncbi:MAG: DEAD/DEAH box helicase [Phycisphaerales bacterium]|nr:DEAD/DEAH box helicase [Phycisphaerales bacterium]
MLVVHACFTDGRLHLWGEQPQASLERTPTDGPAAHPFASPPASLAQALEVAQPTTREVTLALPTIGDAPAPSPQLAHWTGRGGAHDLTSLGARVTRWTTPALAIDASRAVGVLNSLEDADERTHDNMTTWDGDASGAQAAVAVEAQATTLVVGDSVRFFAAAGRLARSLLAEQRFVPMLVQESSGDMRASWRPWLSDEATQKRLQALVAGMPGSCRAAVDALGHDGWAILLSFFDAIVNAEVRAALAAQEMADALAARNGGGDVDPHRQWLTGLLDRADGVPTLQEQRAEMMRSVRLWVGALEDRGISSAWRLRLALEEPLAIGDTAPRDDEWSLILQLQSIERPTLVVEAEDIWALRADSATIEGLRIDDPKTLLLSELARASRLFEPLAQALEEDEPFRVSLDTRQAYAFLREAAPLLTEQGFSVQCPQWWDTPAARVGARLRVITPTLEALGISSPTPGAAGAARLGLNSIVSYEWAVAVGDAPLTMEEFEALAKQRSPLVRINGQWVEVRQEDIERAVAFIRANPGGDARLGEVMRMAYNTDRRTGINVLGVDAEGWAGLILGEDGAQRMPTLDEPVGFHGTLRPYQKRGLSWLVFLDSAGLGPCLADDMGLGKTIQLLALLLHERADGVESPGPTLLVVPMSIVGNWMREAHRFAPSLRTHVHHGAERLTGEAFADKAITSDLVITTYALAHRDREMLERVGWHRVVVDEAQNIKNPSAKQSQAIHGLDAPRRIALTGTPLENRLSELWSIMDFCNPGLLGSAGEFRRHFAVPVERYRDRERGQQLRSLVRPFILRRLKTDRTVISDLPEKLEHKEYCHLTPDQAELYESTVKLMLGEIERAEGIRRRGIVLTTLVRLKQICNHPDLIPSKDDSLAESSGLPAVARSGKCIRLLEMLEEVIDSSQQALIFTQFRAMGDMLTAMVRHAFDRDVLFLHGGVPQAQREKMVDRFQQGDGSAPIFVLSLKAGGVGLNLTAASHVFHFDRWWNPAVENQATDRAFRIGQSKTVNVHKFIVGGTLEDRIDQMIESKVALAEDIIGSGEDWLTEMSSQQLRDVLTLRPGALTDE